MNGWCPLCHCRRREASAVANQCCVCTECVLPPVGADAGLEFCDQWTSDNLSDINASALTPGCSIKLPPRSLQTSHFPGPCSRQTTGSLPPGTFPVGPHIALHGSRQSSPGPPERRYPQELSRLCCVSRVQDTERRLNSFSEKEQIPPGSTGQSTGFGEASLHTRE